MRKTGRLVAIKCMKAQYDSIDKIKKEKEVQALKQLAGHANIVKLLDVLYDEPLGTICSLL
jgi:renal tumor antigen